MQIHVYGTLAKLVVEEEKKGNQHTTPEEYKHANTQWIAHLGAQPRELGQWVKCIIMYVHLHLHVFTQ